MDGQPIRRGISTVASTVGIVGGVTALVARFATMDDVDAVELVSTLVRVFVGVGVFLVLFAWVLLTPVRSRARSLAALPGHTRSYLVGELSRGAQAFRLHPVPRPRSLDGILSLSLVVGADSIELWSGGSTPRLFATIPRSDIRGILVRRMRVNARRARVVEIAVGSGEAVRMVPVNVLGLPWGPRALNDFTEQLEAWRDSGDGSSPRVAETRRTITDREE